MSHSLGKPKDRIRKNKVCLRIMKFQSCEAYNIVLSNPFEDPIILIINKTRKDHDWLIIIFHLLSSLSCMQLKEKQIFGDSEHLSLNFVVSHSWISSCKPRASSCEHLSGSLLTDPVSCPNSIVFSVGQ